MSSSGWQCQKEGGNVKHMVEEELGWASLR